MAVRNSSATVLLVGISPAARAHREKLVNSTKLCSRGVASTVRRAPRRDETTPSARSWAKACRIVPRDTS